MKVAGIVLLIIGIVGTIVFGIKALDQSESFDVLGAEVAVSTGNWAPVIISAVVAIIGFILMSVGKK
ncbi:MAG: hypothetical protein U5K32_13065 [Bacteroidales bacterium]|nr:hypothetical protein [Bacteroidales bacterium]MDZ7739968.1 hypothetical protein [Bacteroidales bacterium]